MLEDLKAILEEENLMERRAGFKSRYYTAFANRKVRESLEIETPPISDLSDLLKIENNGKVQAVRMDCYSGIHELKKPVVAGLILRGVLRREIPKEGIDTLIDAGNMNTGYALGYYAKKFGMKVFYVMSRFFPKDLSDRLEENGGLDFKVVRAPPKEDTGKEREFYSYLFELMRDRAFRSNKHCLWHAKYGGEVLKPLGREIATKLEEDPDYIVVAVGAGSTLECFCEVQSHLDETKPKIIIPEHVDSPIFTKFRPFTIPIGTPRYILKDRCMESFNPDSFRKPPEGSVPHFVIGPHFDQPNPFIKDEIKSKMEYVQQYSNDEWMRMSHYLESHGLPVGNSSAANIAVATNLANQGYKVLTVIFEPMRDYYKDKNLNKQRI